MAERRVTKVKLRCCPKTVDSKRFGERNIRKATHKQRSLRESEKKPRHTSPKHVLVDRIEGPTFHYKGIQEELPSLVG